MLPLFSTIHPKNILATGALFLILLSSCKKDGNPNKLPSVSPEQYAGTIDGYKSSDEIYPKNLVAHWTFDDTWNETLSGNAPTDMTGNSFVDGGVLGKAASINAGYLYYATQFSAFRTDSLKSFTISLWIKIRNNGSKKTMVFQLARPGILMGNINFALNTNAYPADNTKLQIQPYFTTAGNGKQDNLNASIYPTIGADKWTHLVITYNGSSGYFYEWGDGVNVGSYNSRGTGNNLFKSWEPSEVIIGSDYNGIPGKSVNSDVSFAPMTAQVDDIRVFNTVLPDAHIKALYNLGKANK
ncbi:MAG TPA: LamG domain-containing protein [Puia sp.]|nr:LamG domain-containing protein [Puia sp.]